VHSADIHRLIERIERLKDVQDFARLQLTIPNHGEGGRVSILIELSLELKMAAGVEYPEFDRDKVECLRTKILNEKIEADELLALTPFDKGSIRPSDDLNSRTLSRFGVRVYCNGVSLRYGHFMSVKHDFNPNIRQNQRSDGLSHGGGAPINMGG
jgi:hypothetical protein